MTANWPPGGNLPGHEPPTVPPSGYAPPPQPGYGYNWGLAYPAAGYEAVYLVPRPPRPAVVNVAVVLTILGVLVSAGQLVVDTVSTYAHRNDLVTRLGQTNGTRSPQILNDAVDIGIAIAVVVWLLPAAGALVTALLARRGANAARIVLACLMGVFALDRLCGGVFALVNPTIGQVTSTRGSGVSPIFDFVLVVLAVVIGVLVLVPPANRFFSAGPGRRFVAST